ncbi:MAG: hypothetical protein CMD81_10580 [Gammaproteobacteria bacterium]|nr:hypothetical protein [Gammaproteobacteria bacterium]|tara:strand:+ start:1005 stop:1631 length:627 start_codon:yes stop_codon:yes gene_type:complete
MPSISNAMSRLKVNEDSSQLKKGASRLFGISIKPKRTLEEILPIAKEVYNDLRWYHGTTSKFKNLMETVGLLPENRPTKRTRGLFVSKSLNIAHMYGWFKLNVSDTPKLGGIARYFGREDNSFQDVVSIYSDEEKARFINRNTISADHFLVDNGEEPSEYIQSTYHDALQEKIADMDIPLEMSNEALRRVRSLTEDDFRRSLNAFMRR